MTTESPCVFGPEREPWNCRTHRGGVRTRLNESVCSIVVAEGQYGVPLSEEELVEVRVWMRNRRGKPASRGMLAAERLLATLDLERELAATPTASPTECWCDVPGDTGQPCPQHFPERLAATLTASPTVHTSGDGATVVTTDAVNLPTASPTPSDTP